MYSKCSSSSSSNSNTIHVYTQLLVKSVLNNNILVGVVKFFTVYAITVNNPYKILVARKLLHSKYVSVAILHVHLLFWVARASTNCAFHHDFSLVDFEILLAEIFWAVIGLGNNLHGLLFIQWNLWLFIF